MLSPCPSRTNLRCSSSRVHGAPACVFQPSHSTLTVAVSCVAALHDRSVGRLHLHHHHRHRGRRRGRGRLENLDASFLSIVFGGLGGLLLAPRRRDGDRYGAAAWRSLTRRLRRPMLAAEPRCLRLFSGRSAAFMGVSHMCVYVCTKSAFFRRCGCVCARSVRASAILDPCGHVGMRVVCVRDRQKSPFHPLPPAVPTIGVLGFETHGHPQV